MPDQTQIITRTFSLIFKVNVLEFDSVFVPLTCVGVLGRGGGRQVWPCPPFSRSAATCSNIHQRAESSISGLSCLESLGGIAQAQCAPTLPHPQPLLHLSGTSCQPTRERQSARVEMQVDLWWWRLRPRRAHPTALDEKKKNQRGLPGRGFVLSPPPLRYFPPQKYAAAPREEFVTSEITTCASCCCRSPGEIDCDGERRREEVTR